MTTTPTFNSGGLAFYQGSSATVQDGSGCTSGSATWVPIYLFNTPGNTSGPNADFGFQVFVNTSSTTPEPATWLLVVPLLGFLGWWGKSRGMPAPVR